MKSKSHLEDMVAPIRKQIAVEPKTAVILGSGLGHFTKHVADSVVIPYADIPHYPRPTVEGHSGQFVMGTIGQEPVILASGRFHYYEGYDIETITLPQRLFHKLGIKNLIITNAAGSVRKDFQPGDLMAIEGHIDFTFRESSNLPATVTGEPFHSEQLLKLALTAASRENVDLKAGIYTWTLGPAFETPAEIEVIRKLGGDAVGMSTVPEIRTAGKLGINVLGISCLTNYAAGITSDPLTHQEVMETASRVSETFSRLIRGIIITIGEGDHYDHQSSY